MHYLTKKLHSLSQTEKQQVVEEILSSVTDVPDTKTDQMVLELLSDYTPQAKERLEQFGKMQGLTSGYNQIDNLTKGFVGGELTVIAGKTSYGKTTLAINIANHVALMQHPVLFVTLEMTKAEIASRYMVINDGDSEDYEAVSVITAVQATDELNWQSIDGLVERAKSELGVEMVVIDHLHYFTRELDNVAEDLGRVTKELKKNAIRHDIPVLLLSHVRKTGKGDAAGIDDLRGSSYIAQDADVVLMVGRDKEQPNDLYIKIEKNRNRGYDYANDTVKMMIDGIKIYDYKSL